MTFDKFAWFKAMYAETRFPAGEKAVLAHIAIVNVLTGRNTFCVRQDTIAAQCGITRATVGAAIRRAKDLGYLVVSREHDRGYHRNGADELRLLLPELSKVALHDSAELSKDALPNSESGVKQTGEWCKANDPSHVKQTAESCKAPNSPTSRNIAPNSSGEQFSKKTSSGVKGCAPAADDVADDLLNTVPSKLRRTQTDRATIRHAINAALESGVDHDRIKEIAQSVTQSVDRKSSTPLLVSLLVSRLNAAVRTKNGRTA